MSKIFRILILAAAASAVFAMQASAAEGWTMENNKWVYYENGSKVYNQWKTGKDGYYYYLDISGNLATSGFVDGERYVDADGRMVTNAWRQIDNAWYYFDANGKMVTNRSRQINGVYYFFGDTGKMQTGWVSDGNDWYYCDTSSGKMLTSTWKQLPPASDMVFVKDGSGTADNTEADGTNWFYFLATGKAAKAYGSNEYREQAVDGNRYAFDSCGRMVTGWIKLSDTVPAIAGYKYFNDVSSIGTYGAAHVGWLSTYPPQEEGFSSEVQWFYFDSIGRPYYGTDVALTDDDETLVAKFKRLQKGTQTRTYLFNDKGNPVYGLRKVIRTNGAVTSMYFGTKKESCLQLGEKQIKDAEGNQLSFYFDASGYGYTGVKNNKLYYMGLLQKAVDDTHAYYTVNGTTWLVNKSGTVVKNYNASKEDWDVEYKSDSYGHRDGGTGGESELMEPVWVTSEMD